MERQMTLSDLEYGNVKKVTRREKFLQTMDEIVPWARLCALIRPHYYDNKVGRPAKEIETMLRMYFLQIWFSLSDELTEEGIYDSRAMHDFMKIDFLTQRAPDATTLLKFRHLLEQAGLQKKIEREILALLESKGLVMHGGTIEDATLMQAASSTRNSTKTRDPEMASTKKGKNYHFGMKAHVGVDAGSGAVVNTAYTAANEHDVTQAHNCYREDDEVRFGDSAFLGVEKREEIQAMDEGKTVRYEINKRPSQRKEKHNYPINWEKHIESRKSARRWMVEYPFYIVKRIFGCDRAIYRGIDKNGARYDMAFASANLFMFRHRLRTPV
jgi:IS5 family transposase